MLWFDVEKVHDHPELQRQRLTTHSFFWTRAQSDSCLAHRVTLRTGRDLRGGCGAITTDDPLSLALLTDPQVGHCTASTLDSSQRTASN